MYWCENYSMNFLVSSSVTSSLFSSSLGFSFSSLIYFSIWYICERWIERRKKNTELSIHPRPSFFFFCLRWCVIFLFFSFICSFFSLLLSDRMRDSEQRLELYISTRKTFSFFCSMLPLLCSQVKQT